jgi:hypothetical protein
LQKISRLTVPQNGRDYFRSLTTSRRGEAQREAVVT